MTLHVVSQDLNSRTGTVTIEGPSQEDVMSPAAKNLAITTAAGTISRAGISGNESAYPVDGDGKYSEDLIMGRGGAVAAYRCDYNLTGGL